MSLAGKLQAVTNGIKLAAQNVQGIALSGGLAVCCSEAFLSEQGDTEGYGEACFIAL